MIVIAIVSVTEAVKGRKKKEKKSRGKRCEEISWLLKMNETQQLKVATASNHRLVTENNY
jgi:hypothetical protein